MSFVIKDWNLNPNQEWYIKIADAGSELSVELYPTLTDAQAGTNMIASGVADYGTASDLVFTQIAGTSPEIEFFNSDLSWHLKIAGQAGDVEKIFQVKPFTDLREINNNIYKTSDLIQRRALNEINKHTHTSRIRDISIANSISALKSGKVLHIQSVRRNIDVLSIITQAVIKGNKDSLINQIEAVEYIDFTL